jgi:hypothetical protein
VPQVWLLRTGSRKGLESASWARAKWVLGLIAIVLLHSILKRAITNPSMKNSEIADHLFMRTSNDLQVAKRLALDGSNFFDDLARRHRDCITVVSYLRQSDINNCRIYESESLARLSGACLTLLGFSPSFDSVELESAENRDAYAAWLRGQLPDLHPLAPKQRMLGLAAMESEIVAFSLRELCSRNPLM